MRLAIDKAVTTVRLIAITSSVYSPRRFLQIHNGHANPVCADEGVSVKFADIGCPPTA
jgi:hypothetical protein